MNSAFWGRPSLAMALSLLLLPTRLFAAEKGGSAMVIVADSRRFSGWESLWAGVYNESHMVFALVTILVIPSIALALGKLTGWLLGRTGIDLKSRELAEH